MDNKKIILSAYLAASAVGWFLTRSTFSYLAQNSYKFRQLRVAGGLKEGIPVLVALVIFGFLFKSAKVNQLMEEVVTELKKVTWPSREDVVRSTTVVILCIIVASGCLMVFDIFWGKLVDVLFSI